MSIRAYFSPALRYYYEHELAVTGDRKWSRRAAVHYLEKQLKWWARWNPLFMREIWLEVRSISRGLA